MDITIESCFNNICLFDLRMTIEDTAWFLLLLKLVDDSFTTSIKFLHILAQYWQAVKDDSGMLIFCIVDEREDEVDALAHTGDEFPSSL